MRLFPCLVVILLSLSSCQQRYRHVKKVKANPRPTEQSHPRQEQLVVSERIDSTANLEILQGAIPESPKHKADPAFGEKHGYSEKKGQTWSTANTLPEKIQKKWELKKSAKEDPFTFKEVLLVLASFAFWFILSTALVAGLTLLVIWLVLVLPLPALLLALVTSASLGIAFLFVEFYQQAEKMIEDRVGDKTWNKKLGFYYILAVILTLSVLVLSFIYASTAIAIALFALYLIALTIYLFTYKKTDQ